MAFTLTRMPGYPGVVITGTGEGSLEESDEIIRVLESEAAVAPFRGLVLDVRYLEYIPTPEEARRIGATYGAFGAAHRVAMAYLALPGAQYGVARMVQILSEGHGVRAGVFTSFEPALNWLFSDVQAQGA